MSMRNGENSFLKRWGHIQLEKIHEPVRETDETASSFVASDESSRSRMSVLHNITILDHWGARAR